MFWTITGCLVHLGKKEKILVFQSKLLSGLYERASRLSQNIVLTDGEDERVLIAVRNLYQLIPDCALHITLIGNVESMMNKLPSMLPQVDMINPQSYEHLSRFAEIYRKKCLKAGKSIPRLDEALTIITTHEYFGALLVELGLADGMLGGACVPTAIILKAGLRIIGLHPESNVVSGAFLMLLPTTLEGGQDVLAFADCAVLPEPDAYQLAGVALNTIEMVKSVLDIPPITAFLSFSTKGSATHPSLDKLNQAVSILRKKNPSLIIDGEIQADAAIIPAISKKKDPDGLTKGRANILIFPNLHCGNISYKLVERIARAKAIGVILSGFAKPVNDLSRGCSSEDILDMICVTALQCRKETLSAK